MATSKDLICPNGCELDNPDNSGWTLWEPIAICRDIGILADGKIVAHDRDWVNWDIWGSAEPEYCCGLCEGRIPYSEIEGVTFLDRVEPEVNVRMNRKNIFLVFHRSVLTVSLMVPEDRDEYDYDEISREAFTIAAEDLGIPSEIIHSYVHDFSIEE
jgi:hypothetical protein